MEIFEVFDEESGQMLEIQAESLEKAIAIAETHCSECGYFEDDVAKHYEECSKLSKDN